MRRAVVLTFVVVLLPVIPRAALAAPPPPAPRPCSSSLLVLSAFPAELGKILSAAALDPGPPIVANGRIFYTGALQHKRVIMALTGIGPANARATTQTAFSRFRCGSKPGISGVVFSGVAGAGGPSAIGDVTVPNRWTLDGGKTWQAVDPAMLATAAGIARRGAVRLESVTPAGDPACTCQDPNLIKLVTLKHLPRMIIGGDGSTTDPFGHRAVPCLPAGGDLAGCAPCPAALHSPPDAQQFISGVAPLVDPNFINALIAPAPAPSNKNFVANDEETAVALSVASAHHARFIAFRGISDGTPDPLGLPGFPSQFFIYKQLAADNAAAATLAFVRAWPAT